MAPDSCGNPCLAPSQSPFSTGRKSDGASGSDHDQRVLCALGPRLTICTSRAKSQWPCGRIAVASPAGGKLGATRPKLPLRGRANADNRYDRAAAIGRRLPDVTTFLRKVKKQQRFQRSEGLAPQRDFHCKPDAKCCQTPGARIVVFFQRGRLREGTVEGRGGPWVGGAVGLWVRGSVEVTSRTRERRTHEPQNRRTQNRGMSK